MQTELFPTLAPQNLRDHMVTEVPVMHRITFRDTTLICLERDDELFVAMRPVVEGMGLAWQTQHRKLMADSARFNCNHMVTVAEDGKQREMLCLPLRRLNGWLMTISSSKARPEIRATVIAYQQECDAVLFRHFFHDLHVESNALRLLRPRTVAVARLTLEGESRREIATLLAISEASVTYHRRSARRLGLLAA